MINSDSNRKNILRHDEVLYLIFQSRKHILLFAYVDMTMKCVITTVKDSSSSTLPDLGDLMYFLGIEVTHSEEHLSTQVCIGYA